MIRTQVHNAVSVINAIGVGTGAAIGIEAWVTVQVSSKDRFRWAGGPVDARLVDAVRSIIGVSDVPLDVFSQLQPANGLKTSSAVSLAAADILLRMQGRKPTEQELVDLSASASIGAGVSITGAADDAFACLKGGLCIVDNSKNELLERKEVEDMDVIIYLPGSSKPKSEIDREALRREEGFTLALEHLKGGDMHGAVIENGRATAKVLGYDDRPIEMALNAGAMSAGISGTGPASFALTSPESARDIEDALAALPGQLYTTKTTNKGIVRLRSSGTQNNNVRMRPVDAK